MHTHIQIGGLPRVVEEDGVGGVVEVAIARVDRVLPLQSAVRAHRVVPAKRSRDIEVTVCQGIATVS